MKKNDLMFVRVDNIRGDGYNVVVHCGVQSFTLKYNGTKKDCLWMAEMFRIALKNHDKAKENAFIARGRYLIKKENYPPLTCP